MSNGVLRQDQRGKVCGDARNGNCDTDALRESIEATKLLDLYEALNSEVPGKINCILTVSSPAMRSPQPLDLHVASSPEIQPIRGPFRFDHPAQT